MFQTPLDAKKYGPPPSHYVPGFGRGAVGFTTRSDIGPPRLTPDPPSFGLPPSGYVPGFGRGAQSFSKEDGAGGGGGMGGGLGGGGVGVGGAVGGGTAAGGVGGVGGGGGREEEDYSESKYDEWAGYGGSLFAYGDYDEEDREADEIYGCIDRHMDGRRRRRREERLRDELERMRKERPSIGQQFSGCKRDLSKLKLEDWLSIPEIGDYSIKKVKREKYLPVPDKVILEASRESDLQGSVSIKDGISSTVTGLNSGKEGNANNLNGISSVKEGNVSTVGGLNDVGEARGTVLGLKLDKISDSVGGQTNVDKKGYLTDLNSLPIHDSGEIGDYKKARLLLKSVITTNQKNAAGWIAAARVEELDGKLLTARNILAQGIQACPDSEDLWLEAVRLESPEKSKALLGKAVSTLPKSVKLWIAASQKEIEKTMKSKVLRRGLENVPNSIRLWRELIELEGESEAKTLLHKAVECVPHCLEMWLALAKLETYDNAKVVLNKARQVLPTEHSIWVNAAKLEESQGQPKAVIEKVIRRALEILQKNGFKIKREEWLNDAILSEKSSNPLTCAAIIKETLGFSLEEEDRMRVWLEEAESCQSKGNPTTARAIYDLICSTYPHDKSSWLKAIQFESSREEEEEQSSRKDIKDACINIEPQPQTELQTQPQPQTQTEPQPQLEPQLHTRLDELLLASTANCPQEELFWLMSAKRLWRRGRVTEARELLDRGTEVLPGSEELLLARAKIEREEGEVEGAREWLRKGRERCCSVKVWVRSVKLEREEGNHGEVERLCEEGCKKFPQSDKMWIFTASFHGSLQRYPLARSTYEHALELIKTSPRLWISYINFEVECGNFPRARSILENSKVRIKKNVDLWLTCINLELKANNLEGALYFTAKALQEMPESGDLWAMAIELEPKSTRKTKLVGALKQCENDPLVILSIGKIFWKEKKMEKARRWIERSIALRPKLGDAWAYYITIMEETDRKKRIDLREKCIKTCPKEGTLWRRFKRGERKRTEDEILEKVLEEIRING